MTTLLFDDRPVELGRRNLGEVLNRLARQGWEVDHTFAGANRVLLFPTRHKFHIILRKSYETGEDPFEELRCGLHPAAVAPQPASAGVVPAHGAAAPQPDPASGSTLITILYKTTDGEPIEINRRKFPQVRNNSYRDGQGWLVLQGTALPDRLFFGQTTLKEVVLDRRISVIGYESFSRCFRLTDLYCKAATPPTIYAPAFGERQKLKIHVPGSSVHAYKTARVWKDHEAGIVGCDFSE